MRKRVDNVTRQLGTSQLALLALKLTPFLKAFSKNTWLALVFLAIALWLTGPRTNAGAFEFARILVPSEARQLLLEYTQFEFATTESTAAFPSIAPAASAIPSSKIDLAALDAQFLKGDKERQAVANHLAAKYRISMAESLRYVSHAIEVANEVNLDPVLLLAIMATESSFNPNAQSRAGAQGLMQVLTRVHTEKFEPYGGAVAAFVPEANIRVGALILKACIAKAGSLEAGLRSYLGAPNASSGPNSYTYKVIAEREELNDVARNRSPKALGNSNA
jgi:soluble lytic murein transglycosylase-like protein